MYNYDILLLSNITKLQLFLNLEYDFSQPEYFNDSITIEVNQQN